MQQEIIIGVVTAIIIMALTAICRHRDVCEQERYLPACQTGQIYERTGIGEANE